MVQEILDFARSGRVLRGASAILDDSVIVEQNFANALERATDQGQDENDDKDEDWLSWGDIRSHELSQFYLTALEASANSELGAAIQRIRETVRQCLNDNLPEAYLQAINDVDGDLNSCVRSRALMGDHNVFFEKLFEMYQSGTWPCGWEGIYPEGKLVVFKPSS